jgi:Flp pilus assembly protein TadD
MSQVFATFERIAARFVPTPAGPERIGPPPLPVFENYIKGLLAETPATATTFLRAALTGLPTFDRARLALWDVYTEQGDHTRALAAVASVAVDSASAPRARFLAGISSLALKKYDEAFTSFKALADKQPTAAALNNLGIVQLRRNVTPPAAQPVYYFNKAIDVDPNDSDISFNLGYAYWLARDNAAAIYWLRETVRRNPADGDAHFILGTALAATGNVNEASRERELARRLSSTYEQWEKRPAADAVPKGLERVKAGVALPHTPVVVTLASNGQRDQRELARFYFERARRQFQQENDREAVVELNRALYLSPYDASAHLLAGRIHLRNHRLREAIDALKISLWSSETVAAHLALADAYLQNKDPDAARSEAEHALALDPMSDEAKQLIGRINAR